MNVQHHENPWRTMVTPSVAQIVITAWLVLGLAAITTYFLWVYGTQLGEIVTSGLQIQTATNTQNLEGIRNTIDRSEVAANISVFAFWFLVGGISYIGVTAIWHSIAAIFWDVENIVLESHTGRFATLYEVLARLGLRTLGLLMLIGTYVVAKFLLPLYILWLLQLSNSTTLMRDIAILLGAIIGVSLMCHFIALGLRLVFLRVRLFST